MNGEQKAGISGTTREPLLYDVPTASRLLGGLGRTSVYKLMQEGQLRAIKIGKRTFLTDAELKRYVDSLQAVAA